MTVITVITGYICTDRALDVGQTYHNIPIYDSVLSLHCQNTSGYARKYEVTTNESGAVTVTSEIRQDEYLRLATGVYTDGSGGRYWVQHGRLHSRDGPAVICAYGSKHWYIDGAPHRDDGPAVVRSDGSKWWFINGVAHREDGPADINSNGHRIWYVNGRKVDPPF